MTQANKTIWDNLLRDISQMEAMMNGKITRGRIRSAGFMQYQSMWYRAVQYGPVVEDVPSMLEVMGSILNTTEQKKSPNNKNAKQLVHVQGKLFPASTYPFSSRCGSLLPANAESGDVEWTTQERAPAVHSKDSKCNSTQWCSRGKCLAW